MNWRWDDYLLLILVATANIALCYYVYEFVSNYFLLMR